MVTIKTGVEIIVNIKRFDSEKLSKLLIKELKMHYYQKWALVEELLQRLKSIPTASSDCSHKELKRLIKELQGEIKNEREYSFLFWRER